MLPTGQGGGASHQRGNLLRPPGRLACFPSPAGRLYGFRRQRRHKKWRPKGRRTSPAQRYYITPEGGRPEPVREASAGPGQNPWRPGPKARRRHQPSPAKAGVNLREYWKAPSRSRPRRRRLNPQTLFMHIKKPAPLCRFFDCPYFRTEGSQVAMPGTKQRRAISRTIITAKGAAPTMMS